MATEEEMNRIQKILTKDSEMRILKDAWSCKNCSSLQEHKDKCLKVNKTL